MTDILTLVKFKERGQEREGVAIMPEYMAENPIMRKAFAKIAKRAKKTVSYTEKESHDFNAMFDNIAE